MSERDTNLYNELAESVLTAPIEDLEEEIRMEGGDPDKVAEEVREVLRNAIRARPVSGGVATGDDDERD